jgi:hypothetical protein
MPTSNCVLQLCCRSPCANSPPRGKEREEARAAFPADRCIPHASRNISWLPREEEARTDRTDEILGNFQIKNQNINHDELNN